MVQFYADTQAAQLSGHLMIPPLSGSTALGGLVSSSFIVGMVVLVVLVVLEAGTGSHVSMLPGEKTAKMNESSLEDSRAL